MEQLMEYLPILVPLFILQLILLIAALANLIKNKKVKILNVPIWLLIIIFVNIIGPVLYLIFGRADE